MRRLPRLFGAAARPDGWLRSGASADQSEPGSASNRCYDLAEEARTADLSDAPAGKTYQLWLIAADGSARSVGLLRAAPTRPVLVRGLSAGAEVGMTIEPAGGSFRPTTTPVMVAALEA